MSELRRDARKIFLAAVHAAEPAPLVHSALLNAPELHRGGGVRILALGKAAPGMAAAALETLGSRVSRCLVVSTAAALRDVALPPIAHVIAAGHPLPDDSSVLAGRLAFDLVRDTAGEDIVVALISGGASALVAQPVGVSLDEYRQMTHDLLRDGADIQELNRARSRVDAVKDGGLARALNGRPAIALLVSDVIGNDPAVIASGPFHVTDGATSVRTQILTDNAHAVDAAVHFATRLGYAVVRVADPVAGPARSAGARLATQLLQHPPGSRVAIVSGGETTVTVRGGGRGGRSQELALAAAFVLEGAHDVVALAGGTDGIDGNTDAAGGMVDGGSCARMRERGIDPADALERNDSWTALERAGDLLITGVTGTNVCDVQVLVRG